MERLSKEGNKYKVDNARRAIEGGAKSLSLAGVPVLVEPGTFAGQHLHRIPGAGFVMAAKAQANGAVSAEDPVAAGQIGIPGDVASGRLGGGASGVSARGNCVGSVLGTASPSSGRPLVTTCAGT